MTETPLPGSISPLDDILLLVAERLDRSFGSIAIDWGKSQDQTFYQQMQGGIRYFDLRAGWDIYNLQWVTFHTVIGSPVQLLLNNISYYLHDYPTEIVILEISHFDGSPSDKDIQTLKNMVLDTLGPYLHAVDTSFRFSISEMVSTNKRAIVTMEQGSDNITLWPPSAIYNTYANTPDLSKMVAFNNETVYEFMNNTWPGTLFKVSWTLTPDADTIIGTEVPFKPHTLIQLADSGNKALPSFWNNMKKYKWRMGNILIIDHYETSEIIKIIWAANGITN